jgi:hypothetical protein
VLYDDIDDDEDDGVGGVDDQSPIFHPSSLSPLSLCSGVLFQAKKIASVRMSAFVIYYGIWTKQLTTMTGSDCVYQCNFIKMFISKLVSTASRFNRSAGKNGVFKSRCCKS